MAEQVKKVNGLVTITLTKRQADWLYDLLNETLEEASTRLDEQQASEIADKLDIELGKI